MVDTASPSLRRLQASARRLFLRLGFRADFQRYALNKDWDRGGESAEATGAPVKGVACKWDEITKTKGEGDKKVRVTVKVLCVEMPAFADLGGLSSDEWRFTDPADGLEKRIAKAVHSTDGTYWVAEVASAGR